MDLGNRTIRGVLVDIDGVLYVDDTPVAGAVAAIERLAVPHLYLTNTTTVPVRSIEEKLRSMGFPVAEGQVLTAPLAAVEYLRSRGSPPARLVVSDEVVDDFAHYPTTDDAPRAIVIGDIGGNWSYALLNELFQSVMDGAEIVALHKNKFWQKSGGLQLDIGAFVAAIEYASGRQATVVGKPNAAFFEASLRRLGVGAESVAMIGDDIDSDVGGAQALGILGILVKTGKYREEYTRCSNIRPDGVLGSIADLGSGTR